MFFSTLPNKGLHKNYFTAPYYPKNQIKPEKMKLSLRTEVGSWQASSFFTSLSTTIWKKGDSGLVPGSSTKQRDGSGGDMIIN